jgi:hypothetical protein
MNWKKIVWIAVIAIVLIIQLIPSGRPEVIVDNPNDLLANNTLPDSVTNLLRSACYDCHSNETVYPWYAYVAPVSWLVIRDTKLGRAHLNFSDWENNSKVDKAKLLGEIAEEVEDGVMPMPIYILMHPEAKLTVAQRELLIEWSDEFAESLFE